MMADRCRWCTVVHVSDHDATLRLKRAAAYAHDKGLDSTYSEARELAKEYDVLAGCIAEAKAHKRTLEHEITDRETELVADEVMRAPGASQAAMDRWAKNAFVVDPSLRDMRARARTLAWEIDRDELRFTSLGAQIRLLTARIEEVGQYLGYLSRYVAPHNANEAGDHK